MDRITANKPAKLLDSKSLTLGFSRKQIWPVFLCNAAEWQINVAERLDHATEATSLT